MKRIRAALSLALALGMMAGGQTARAQDAPAGERAAAPPPGFRTVALGDGPWTVETEMATLHVERVGDTLDHPWSLAFLPDGGMLVTERPGRLRIIRDGQLDPQPIAGLPAIFAFGLAGLMDVALHPDFAENGLIYFSYSKPHPDAGDKPGVNADTALAVARAHWDGGHQLSNVEDIFVAAPWYGSEVPERCCGQGPAFGSYGGRIAFGPDGFLYVTSGDRNYGEMVQDQSNDFGKILRLTDDGKPAPGNPFAGQEGWQDTIWSTGHRNPLGLYFDPLTGKLWETEFGPRGGDELNLIEKGVNYGWMDVTQGHHYNGEAAKGIRAVDGMKDPAFAFGPPSINPGNIAVYHGAAFPGWEGDLLMPAMSKSLVRMEVNANGAVTAMETMLEGLEQRLRDVKIAPDGTVYVLTDETEGALLKITPAAE
ncbi:glucose/arabinose dehydrogenase [Altererythrobacter atlanticus]|uniref:Soluble aldose sugar dehydrogenase YliI n=1 Tax=Croceibacterium atlanticum TaxID=1267766 RepID=A0A0F7KR23_9SPHN|nr:PQQ-dependent sugar dehydrogenase [Croceibacterium atlanticum]AKH42933.1 Soluble aldose sugar dehydrogenase YliI precursor [Croceibacterium atlanticum]MBB5734110.1 glucose/arabinose dehydrogenase [Croceibacterium atlanticum]